MDDLRIILTGHGHNIFQYIKCLVDQSEKDGKMYSVQWVLYGIVVIGHVYTMILCQTRSIERAKAGSTRAIGLYIEFIAQLSMIDTDSSGAYAPYTIGCKDAAQFVYKKIFPDIHHEHPIPDLPATLDTKSIDIPSMTAIQLDTYLETLHEYKQIIQNMVHVLFSKELFYDKSEIDGSPSYYSDVISRLLQVNTTLEQLPICISLYRHIVSSQCANNNTGDHTERMTPQEYFTWINGIICQ
jgi:hypothetical protein